MANDNLAPGKTRNSVLVVIDDEEQILLSLRSLFRRDGYKMYFFPSGKKALEFLEKNNADVILCDMRMPEMSGAALLEQSTKLCPDAINIIVSGYEEKTIIFDAISKGLARQYIMKPWEDEQLRKVVKEAMDFQHNARKKHLMGILHSFNNLPSPPTLHNKLKAILKNEQPSQKEIAIEIEKSTALIAKLLRLANSIFYGARKSISNVYDAITFIGTEEVLNIVLSLESFDNLITNASEETVSIIEDIQIKSIKRAQLSREIALKWEEKIEPHKAYVAGLMLDIGLVLRYCYNDKKIENYSNNISGGNKPIYNLDKEIFKVTHDEVGEAILTYWNFPPDIISAVANHHCYTNKDTLTTIVQIADAIIQEKDSLPHDPEIDGVVEFWKENIKEFLEKINISKIFEDNDGNLC
jgi:HD-like signal output (HDOD) protein